MTKAVQQDVALLAAAKQGLRYLTANDWALIADKSARITFKTGETLLQRGADAEGIYLLLKGSAKVVLPGQTFSSIGAGEICGEMSFLDEQPASANVVANEAVEAFFVDRATLQSLFELFPHLASRFYRSLAANLSRRLREMIDAKPTKPSKL